MDRQAVRSRDIAIIGYEKETSTLEVTFRNGGVYHYAGVPEPVYRNLLTAPSHGTYFNRHVKDKYPYKKIT